MEEEELEELARQPIPPTAQQVPSVGHGGGGNPQTGALDDANDDLTGRTPGAPLTNDQLARAAVIEQMAHGGGYRGNETGNAARATEEGEVDLNPMLVENGYLPDPQVVRGANGLEMVVYRPMPGSNQAPVVAFRGTQESPDLRTDFDVAQVGDAQYEANRAMIDRTMEELSSQYPDNRPEVTGHSLGGALAQRVAADHPGQTGHITTFQAPGINSEQVEAIEEYNREHPDRPLTADHFRVEGDIVPLAGEGHAPGSVHVTGLAPGADESLPGPARAHMAYIATPYALQTEEGREALVGFDRSPNDYASTGGLRTEEVDESMMDPERLLVETHRRIVGAHIEMADMIGLTDAVRNSGDNAVDLMDRTLKNADHTVDRVQGRVDAANDAGNAAVDDAQQGVAAVSNAAHSGVNRVQEMASDGEDIVQSNIDGVQGAVDRGVRSVVNNTATDVLLGGANVAVDTAQSLAHRGVSTVDSAIDTGQRLAQGTENVAAETIDAGQSTVRSAVRSGQAVVDRGQAAVRDVAVEGAHHVHDAWNWLTE